MSFWATKTNMPTARSDSGAAEVDGMIYVYGGNVGAGATSYTSALEMYNPATDTWATKTPGTVRGSVAVGAIGGKLYAVGGEYNLEKLTTGRVYDPSTDQWASIASLPTGTSNAACGVVEDRLYVVGSSDATKNNYCYDPVTNSWTKKADIPSVGSYPTGASASGKLYVFTKVDSNDLVYCYDPTTNQWTLKASRPSQRQRIGMQAAVIGHRIVLAGGLSASGALLNTAEVYDTVTDTWEPLPDLPGQIRESTLASANGKVYVIGGYNTTWTRQNWELTPNNPPTLALSSPSDNQVLAEGNSYPVEGTASDADIGNVVTVKYQINNGPVRALQSGVSDGSTPISFVRNLVYRNKRIWDGSIDVAGVDLAENTDHTLKVWSEDDQGGKSAEVTRNFRVIHNRPPVISGSNEDLGTIMVPPTKTYTVTEPEANPFTVTEKINGTVIRSFPGVAGRGETVTIPHDLWLRLDLDTPHTLTVEATESQGLTSTRTFTFIRTETHIEFLLNFDNPAVAAHFTPDGMPKRVLVTLERYLPPGASIESVKVCNNALDAEPTWEDATAAVVAGRGYLFTNQTKTADNWRINIWVVIAKGTATERVRLDGLGGAFD